VHVEILGISRCPRGCGANQSGPIGNYGETGVFELCFVAVANEGTGLFMGWEDSIEKVFEATKASGGFRGRAIWGGGGFFPGDQVPPNSRIKCWLDRVDGGLWRESRRWAYVRWGGLDTAASVMCKWKLGGFCVPLMERVGGGPETVGG